MKHRNSAVFVAVLFVILVIFACYFLNNSMKTQYSQMFNNSGDPLITLNGKLNIKLFPGPQNTPPFKIGIGQIIAGF